MKTRYLSQEEKRIGQKHYYRFQMLNGAGYNFLGDTIVYLLAIHFNASNLQLGYISSAVYLTGILLPLVPKMFAGKNLLALQQVAWFFRGLVGLGYGALFFISGNYAVWLILVLYTLFCLFRLVGVVVINPLMKQISSARNRGSIISQVNISFQSISILAKLFSVIVTSLERLSGVLGLILLQFLGFIFNTLSIFELRKVPCRATIDYTKGRNIFVVLGDAFARKNERIVLLLGWFNVSSVVLVSLTIPFLRRGLGFANNYVVFYSMFIGIAIILAGVYTRAFGDRIGSRPFLILGSIGFILCMLVWMIIPLTASFSLVLGLGFITNFFLLSNAMFINRLYIQLIPEHEGIVYNSMNNFIVAICSLIFGILGGVSIDLGQHGPLSSLAESGLFNTHYLLFGMTVLLGAVGLLLSLRIQERSSISGKQAAAMLLSYEGLKAYVDIGRLNRIKNPLKQKTVLFSISDNANDVATEEIRRLLASPLSKNKSSMIQSLFDHRRPVLLDSLIEIASDPDSYHQQDAIFALGAYRSEKSKAVLLDLFRHSDDERIRSNAAKSLGRIGCSEIVEEVKELVKKNHPVWVQMNYIIALKNMDPESLFLEGLFRPVVKGRSKSYRQTIYSLYAAIMGYEPSLAAIYQERNLKQGNGLEEFLEDARDTVEVYDHYEEILGWFSNQDWQKMVSWCVEAAGTVKASGAEDSIRMAIIQSGALVDLFDYDDVLACFFFTYQLVRSR